MDWKRLICTVTAAAMLAACACCAGEGDEMQPINDGFVTYTDLWTEGLQKNFSEGESYALDLECNVGPQNYLRLAYTSECNLDGTLEFTDAETGTKSYSERFFLTPKDTVFRQILDYYGEYPFEKVLKKITFTCVGEGGAFALTRISAATHPVDFAGIDFSVSAVKENLQVFIKGKHTKLGVTLKSGGGIDYLSSLGDGVSLIQENGEVYVGHGGSGEVLKADDINLINAHDTGRLVQQSYYGSPGDARETPTDSYEAGTYEHDANPSTPPVPWPYNPVQGGDQHNNVSQIIDAQYSETRIYVKARPLDWAKNKSVTPFYVENTYEILEDSIFGEYVKVTNSCTDFSGYDHGDPRDQELPAFYGISPLGRFVSYKGNKPWTGDTPQTVEKLGFWSPGTGENRFLATENWIGWVNAENWGIGIYVPDVHNMLCGRHMPFGERGYMEGEPLEDPASWAATTYVAPLGRFTMPNYKTFSYSYFLKLDYIENARPFFEQLHSEGASNPDVLALNKGEF